MTKAEEKRAAIIAQQAARQLAEGGDRQASGTDGAGSGGARKRRTFRPMPPFGGPRPGRPPNKT